MAAFIMNILRGWVGERTLRGHYYDLKTPLPGDREG